MGFGIYVHIPYCIQKCHYCDFTTFSLDHRIQMPQYMELLLQELRLRHSMISQRNLDSVYFGGGTPSLLPAKDILTFMNELANVGFQLKEDAEVTIEINPGTIDDERLDLYRDAGVNRYSVGVQSFRDSQLNSCGREHTSTETRKDLDLLKKRNLNFSVDLLFGLPHQDISEIDWELDQFLSYEPSHISAYNLTIPKGHPMNKGRAEDTVQAEMFDHIERRLLEKDIHRYELSNFSKPGYGSKHNMLYFASASGFSP